jgi:hypothetical protein
VIGVKEVDTTKTLNGTDVDWLSTLALVSAGGVLLVAIANAHARAESEWALAILYVGLLAIFLPIAACVFARAPTRGERIGLVIVLGMSLYVVKVLFDPTMFTRFDELLHWRTAHDLVTSGRLFSPNSMLPISPLYPGLEIVTGALVSLTGLDIFHAGVLVVAMARLLLMLALFLLFEEISQSARVAGIATLVYVSNPSFIFFDAQFGYESLALPLGVLALYLLARRAQRSERARGWTFAILLTLGAIVVTHHLSSFAFAAFIVLLALVARRVKTRAGFGWFAVLDLVAIFAWLILVAPAVLGYLAPYTIGAVEHIARLLLNEVTPRPLFTDYSGQASPLWERVISFGAIAVILLGLVMGWREIWRHARANVFAVAFGIASLAYIVGLPLRLLPSLGDVSARSAAFLFLAIALVLALAFARFERARWQVVGVTSMLVLFWGGYILGAGPLWARVPGPYLVAADMRSIERQGIAAAEWARAYLNPRERIGADRINSLLLGSYGLQQPITHLNDRVDISPLYFAPTFDDEARLTLAFARMRYVLVDRRLSTGLPRLGVYFEASERDAFHHKTPLARKALIKFDEIAGARRVFDSGDIVIYDLENVK